jgi:hypothetical protein
VRTSLLIAAILAAIALPLKARAHATTACFTPDETIQAVLTRDKLAKGAADCLRNYWKTHNDFFKQNHYSKYYGNRSKTLDTPDKRAKAILLVYWPNILAPAEMQKFLSIYRAEGMQAKPNAKPEDLNPGLSDLEKYIKVTNPALYTDYMQRKPSFNLDARASDEVSHDAGKRGSDLRGNVTLPLQNISCIDMARRCLREGFKAAGMESTFEKVDKVTREKDLSGVEMIKALSDLGWKVLYFNPDITQNAAWDADERQIMPPNDAHKWQGAWGDHVYSWGSNCDPNGRVYPGKAHAGVNCSMQYMAGRETPVPVDDKELLVNFGTTVPDKFKAVPFFVGTAHAGYHVFPGFSGNIIEAHSTRPLASSNNLQVSKFNPLDQDHDGGPRWTNSEHYRTGVVAVPPGYLDDVATLHRPIPDANGCVDVHPELSPNGLAASALPGHALPPQTAPAAPSAPAPTSSTITGF